MQAYQQFAVYALRDKQPVFTDGTATEVLRTVDRNTRLNVIRREGVHYMVRILNQVAFVPVDDVSTDRSDQPIAKFGDWATSDVRETNTYATPGGDGSGSVDIAQLGYVAAGFVTRFLAFLIDSVVIGIVCNVVSGILMAALGLEPLQSSTNAQGMETVTINWNDYGTIALVVIPIYFAYFIAGWSTIGTLGMVIMKVHVIDNNTGRAPDFAGSTIRALVAVVSAIPLYLGYFWALWGNSRTWHDIAANTSVVQYR